MKFNPGGILHLKPFDETTDAQVAGATYASSPLLAIGILASAGLGLAALALVLFGLPSALPVLGMCVAASAVTAGLEWHANLKARALNQLFAALVMTGVVCLLKSYS